MIFAVALGVYFYLVVALVVWLQVFPDDKHPTAGQFMISFLWPVMIPAACVSKVIDFIKEPL